MTLNQPTASSRGDPDCEDTRTVATLYYNRSAALRKKGEFEKALDDANMALAPWTEHPLTKKCCVASTD